MDFSPALYCESRPPMLWCLSSQLGYHIMEMVENFPRPQVKIHFTPMHLYHLVSIIWPTYFPDLDKHQPSRVFWYIHTLDHDSIQLNLAWFGLIFIYDTYIWTVLGKDNTITKTYILNNFFISLFTRQCHNVPTLPDYNNGKLLKILFYNVEAVTLCYF